MDALEPVFTVLLAASAATITWFAGYAVLRLFRGRR